MTVDRFSALPLDRRGLIKGASALAGLLALPVSVSRAFADNPTGERLHGLSAFGDLKYASDFTHFDYVEPDAPKGGRINYSVANWVFNQNPQTFNTLNTFVLTGDAPPRMELCFDSLMVSALDEPDSIYCHAAEWVEISPDRNTFTFGLREGTRFHDATPLSAEDVAFSFNLLKEKGHPSLVSGLRAMKAVKALDERTVELVLDGTQSGRSILSIAALPILSRLYYSANAFDSSSLGIPLSSGPYRPSAVESGRYIEYSRIPDYWAKDLPTARGLDNFDIVRIDFFAERTASFEAFKKGVIHWRQEATSQIWATGYNFPAVTDGRVIKTTFEREKRPTMQSWALNQRRAPFDDERVRRAIALCFDFEWTNKNIFYGIYTRSQSMFENSDFKAEGMPGEAELALMDSLQNSVPEAARGEAAVLPSSDGSGRDRDHLRQAFELLSEAGFQREGGRLLREGKPLEVELLINSAVFERVLGNFVANLNRLGVSARMRLVDPAQFNARLTSFDFDMVMSAVSFSPTPTRESLGELLSTDSADRDGSYNLPGVKNPLYDELLDYVGRATSREELVTVMRVLDRVLRARLDWIPNWHSANHLVAYWDRFGFPEQKPDYGWPVERLWWQDEEKAAAIDA